MQQRLARERAERRPIGVEHETSSGGAGSGDAAIDFTAADDLARANCDRVLACAPGAFRNRYNSRERCFDDTSTSYRAVLGWPKVGDVASQLSRCADAIRRVQCDYDPAMPECTFTGELDDGAPCGNGAQCRSGVCKRAIGQCGTCAQPAQAGESCDDERPCTRGLVAQRAGDGGTGACTCVVPPREDQPCTTTCAVGLRCANRVCKKPLPKGSPCTTSNACDVDKDQYCRSGLCSDVPRVPLGQACHGDAGCLDSQCESGTCVAWGVAGDGCSDDIGCRFGLDCVPTGATTGVTGICTKRDPGRCVTP
ncbi:MAG: hypothetical protein KIT84_32030 [Labilithrix sp.]|nr:hypothetical protein [Labilithrix sp.]MCW5815701.1 hypothetical protein [Labilithrix sp.]